MSWGDNVYSKPEEYDLSILGEAYRDVYGYSKFVVWEGYDGRLFYGCDSGCSCASPFETVKSEDELHEARTVQEVHDALDAWASPRFYEDDDSTLNAGSVADLHMKLSEVTRSFPYES